MCAPFLVDRPRLRGEDAGECFSIIRARRKPVHVRLLGKDPESQEGQSPTLFATDRTDRKTYIAQGWIVTDPAALAELGDIPPGEAVIEIPADVLRFAEELR